jgi:hypothetical protein
VQEDLSTEPKVVGESLGFVILRGKIRHQFHASMEPPSEDTMELALTLFDRYGNLKNEIIDHPVRKGSGVWKEELNNGNMVLIESVRVDQKWRRKGIGKQLVLKLLENAMATKPNIEFAFALSAVLNDRTNDESGQKSTKQQKQDLHQSRLASLTQFFHSLQFRRVGVTEWLALARDEKHPAHQLECHKDPEHAFEDSSDSESDENTKTRVCNVSMKLDGSGYDISSSESATSDLASNSTDNAGSQSSVRYTDTAIFAHKHPLHYAIKGLSDEAGIKFLQKGSFRGVGLEDTDGNGDTVLHIAAKSSKIACLTWIVNSTSGARLLNIRNGAGYTPLEALEARLERERICKPYGWCRTICIADKFDGFGDNSVACLLKLTGLELPTDEQRQRARFGCSCGQCLAGFLSPRMVEKLRDEANSIHDLLKEFGTLNGGEGWHDIFEDLLIHLPEQLKLRFRRSKVLQRIFTALIDAIATCLENSLVPHKLNATKILQSTSIWSQLESHYFQRGGSVAAIVHLIIDEAKDSDAEAGSSLFNVESEDDLSRLPKCRNDREFQFVRRHCVDDAPEEPEKGTGFP